MSLSIANLSLRVLQELNWYPAGITGNTVSQSTDDFTVEQIAIRVLQEFRRLPEGQTARSGQTKIVKNSYAGLYDELFSDKLVTWDNNEDIPAIAVYPIITLLKARTADVFGVSNEWVQLTGAMKTLLGRQIATPADLVTESYNGLYTELFNDSLVNWSSTDDIPDFALFSIITILKGRNAILFGVKDIWSISEDRMKRKLAGQVATPYESEPTPIEDF